MKKLKKKYKCDNCGTRYSEDELVAAGTFGLGGIDHLSERVDENGPVPAGECPEEDCGALVYLVEPSLKDQLVELLERYGKEEGTTPRGALRDMVTDLMHIADDEDYDFVSIYMDACRIGALEKKAKKV